jgi:RNA polymerase sigma-70 factor (sigma-E family)
MSVDGTTEERQAMTGSDAEFRQFVEARYGDLLRLAYALTGSMHEAEDLVQGSLVRVMRRWAQVEEPMAYMRRVMINQRVTRWRRFGRREVPTANPPDGVAADPSDGVAERHAILAALRALPPRMRAVVALRYVADLPEAEVAATLDCSVGTVKSQTAKALAKLRSTLGSRTPAPVHPSTEATTRRRS